MTPMPSGNMRISSSSDPARLVGLMQPRSPRQLVNAAISLTLLHDRGSGRRCRRLYPFFMPRVGVPADDREHDKEPNDIGDGNMPAVTQPEPDRFRFGIEIGERDAGGGTEPDHRAAEADCIGQ